MNAMSECRESSTLSAWRWTSSTARIKPIDTTSDWRECIRIIDDCDLATSGDTSDIIDINSWETIVTCNGCSVHSVIDGGVPSLRLRHYLTIEITYIGVIKKR